MVVFFHGHNCVLTQNCTSKRFWETRQEKYRKTLDTNSFIQSKGYAVIEMWECHFKAYCNNHPDIKPIIQESRPNLRRDTEAVCLTNRSVSTFVLTICLAWSSVTEVPDEWDPEFRQQTNLSPKEFFAEMCPLFCNAEVSFDLIGEHMQTHAREQGLSEQPRRLLIGAMSARQLLVSYAIVEMVLRPWSKSDQNLRGDRVSSTSLL